MLIGEPMPSQYDWRFSIFQFPVRVTWLFWAVGAALGYSSCLSIDDVYLRLAVVDPEFRSPGLAALLVVWIAAMFVSILVHELGHSMAFRFFGVESEIVLYHMGGLAIPTAGYLFRRAGRRHQLTPMDQLIVSAAGPGLQFVTGVVIAMIAAYMDVLMPFVEWILGLVNLKLGGTLPKSAWVFAAFSFYVRISLLWSVFNLLPVYPMDGGHIAKQLFAMFRRTDGEYEARLLGAITGFAVAGWLYTQRQEINAILFVSMALSNVQALQQLQGPRNW